MVIREIVDKLIAETTKHGECLISPRSASQVYANIKGYGKAHRYIFEFFKGPIPKGQMVCHSCDTPKCINIEHLFLGSALDNMLDKVAKGRQHFGGPGRILSKEEIQQAADLYDMGYTYQEIGDTFNVSRRTIARALSTLSISTGDSHSICMG